MGFCKLIDSMVFGLGTFVWYGFWALFFGLIALLFGVIYWSTIKIILIGIGILLATIFLLEACGVKLS